MRRDDRFNLEHFMFMVYVLSILGGSYLAVSTFKNMYVEARRLEYVANATFDGNDGHKVLVYDSIEPASGR